MMGNPSPTEVSHSSSRGFTPTNTSKNNPNFHEILFDGLPPYLCESQTSQLSCRPCPDIVQSANAWCGVCFPLRFHTGAHEASHQPTMKRTTHISIKSFLLGCGTIFVNLLLHNDLVDLVDGGAVFGNMPGSSCPPLRRHRIVQCIQDLLAHGLLCELRNIN